MDSPVCVAHFILFAVFSERLCLPVRSMRLERTQTIQKGSKVKVSEHTTPTSQSQSSKPTNTERECARASVCVYGVCDKTTPHTHHEPIHPSPCLSQ
mmetsp:Transcript_35340/g.87832  ORF Transcript_35340/g.87832 Transcript_35340/m.87832 type:complete len:97 (+) Transcript_35340:237-527(+)